MAYTVIDKPSDYFNTVLYTGTGAELAISGVGFQPDWTWIKIRNESSSHEIFDSVRGATKTINSNTNGAEATIAQTLKSFDSDGFTLGTDGDVNYDDSQTGVAWNWKAGTAFTNDASATGVGSIDSAGSVNTDAGFSIIRYGGTGSLGTVAHGLGVAPSFIAFKRLDTTGNWVNYHKSIGATKYLRFDTDSAEITASDEFNDTEPTSTVFTVETDGAVNASGTNNIIAYCFADVKGYSKFGEYAGNGNADGTFVYTGFKPAFVMVKRYDGAGQGWNMFDNKRDPFNLVDEFLIANSNNAEATGGALNLDFLSNGFKFRGTDGGSNTSGSEYIYMAFAESPFTTSTGIPATAR
tara:strand:- start:53 stop:1108 length:1056 start_codon:yes stop_codon:yes gene_type:complete